MNGDETPEIGAEMPDKGRVAVDLECEIRVGSGAWRKTRIADLTPAGFQVRIMAMPPRGTHVFLRFANLQMLQAEVCWSDSNTAGCKFETPLRDYVFDHIIANAPRA